MVDYLEVQVVKTIKPYPPGLKPVMWSIATDAKDLCIVSHDIMACF